MWLYTGIKWNETQTFPGQSRKLRKLVLVVEMREKREVYMKSSCLRARNGMQYSENRMKKTNSNREIDVIEEKMQPAAL